MRILNEVMGFIGYLIWIIVVVTTILRDLDPDTKDVFWLIIALGMILVSNEQKRDSRHKED